MNKEVLIKSFAKINIGLRILRKRTDGYHDLETIFYPIKLYDEIFISAGKSSENVNSVILKSNKSYLPLNRENLCYKAVEKFFSEFKIRDHYKIRIELKKNIPVGGGLGGGSSNASAVIRFLTKYFGIDIEKYRSRLLNTALGIGSDVPFFLLMKPCYATGRGEKLKILSQFNPDFDILIVNPNLHISTKWAFDKLNLSPGFEKETALNNVQVFDPERSEIYENDFEKIVFEKYNLIGDIKTRLLDSGAVYASMSGSGATVFGFFRKNENIKTLNCRNSFLKQNFFTFISG